jgi:hypothetical protein
MRKELRMKTELTYSLLAVGIMLSAAGYAPAPQETNKAELVDFQYSRWGLKIGFPKDWTTKEEMEPTTGLWTLMATSPPNGDDFAENVNVVVVPAGTTDLKEQSRRGIAVLKQRMPGFSLIEEGYSRLGENDVAWFTNTHEYQGHTLKATAYSILHGKELFIITCTTLPDTYDRYAPAFKDIVSSVRFDSPGGPAPQPLGGDSKREGHSVVEIAFFVGGLAVLYEFIKAFVKKK